MRIIESLIGKFNKKIVNRDLYYGYIYLHDSTPSETNTKTARKTNVSNFDDFVIMQKLTRRERNSYLKSRYNTFFDGENAQTLKYMKLKNSEIEYYRIPSMHNMIVPQTPTTLDSMLVDEDFITLSTCSLYSDISVADKYLSADQIREYEDKLNENKQLTSYYNGQEDYDFREYYEW